MRKKLLSIILSLAMVLTMIPAMGSSVFAADTEIQNVNLAADGTLTWDAFAGAKYYDFNISNFNVIFEGTECNLSQILEDKGKASGSYTVEIYAKNEDYIAISAPYYLTYTYTAKNPQLATPANFKWSGSTVSWDPVENATSYYVFVYEDSFAAFYIGSPKTVTENSIDIADCLYDGTYKYGVIVIAKAKGYPDSEQGRSDFTSITKELPALTGVKIVGSNISWNEFPEAAAYEIAMSSFSTNIYDATTANLNELLRSFGRPSGEYEVKVSAVDPSNKHISKTWTGTYSYTAREPLNKPMNLVWADKTITWDPVANASSYEVLLFENSYSSVARAAFTTAETSFEIPTKYLDVGTKNYGVYVKAMSDEYPSSENAVSEFHAITYIKPSIQNAKINDGVLTWDAMPGAKDYIFDISEDDIGATYTEATSLDVDAMLKASPNPSGEYSLTLSARDSEGNSISTTTLINYHYVIKCDILVRSSEEEKGTVAGSGRYSEGDDVTIQAYPKEGYIFGWWTDKWGSVVEGAGKEYTFVADPFGSPEYTAWFELCPHEQIEETAENIMPATMTTDGSYDKVISCKDCCKEISRENLTLAHIDSVKLATTIYSYNGSAKSPSLTVKDADGNVLVKGTDYTVTVPSGRKNVGTYTYKVTFKGNYSGTKSVSFKINPATASVKSLTPGKKKMTVKMTTKPSSKGASTYQIYYKQKGTSNWKKTTTTAQSKTIKSLKKGKYYYVKVRAYKKVGTTTYYGAWSKTKLSKKIK